MASFGRYEIQEQIGAGGFGRVYRGWDPVLAREVAIKASLSVDPEMLARFEREARISASLHHPNIAETYDFGVQQGMPFLVQELLDGQDLAVMIGAAMSHRRKLEILLEIAAGLGFAHQRGVVHRDLKPSNVRLLSSGRVKVLDFGLAVSLEQTRLTRTGVVVGTVAYLSPEQCDGSEVDRRSDIFTFGTVAYELLSGCLPFGSDSVASMMAGILFRSPKCLSDRVDGLPGRVSEAVERCLEKRPEDRYQDLEAVANEFSRALESGDWKESPVAASGDAASPQSRSFLDRTEDPKHILDELEETAVAALDQGDPSGAAGLLATAFHLLPADRQVRRRLDPLCARLVEEGPAGGREDREFLREYGLQHLKRRRWARVWLGVAALLLAALGVTSLYFRGKVRFGLGPATTASIEVRSNVRGDSVFLDGQSVGSTPLTIRAWPGRHELEVTKLGCKSASRTLELTPDDVVRVRLQLDCPGIR